MIPEIDIWRVANLMLKRYGDEADIESALRAEELAEESDHNGAAVWRRDQLALRRKPRAPTPELPSLRCSAAQLSWSSSAFASFRSRVSEPSVNQS